MVNGLADDGNRPGTFGKGCKPGPGRPPLAPELKNIPRLTKEQLEATIAKYNYLPLKDLEVLKKDMTLMVLDHMVISIIIKALKHGDQNRMQFLLDRTIGRVKEVKEIVLPQPTYIERANGHVIELGAEMIESGDGDE